jgi:hypothetical protein
MHAALDEAEGQPIIDSRPRSKKPEPSRIEASLNLIV